jgi:FXSXX-COOH protein
MHATDVRDPELVSSLTDLRQVPLADISALDKDILDNAVRRLVPDRVARPVPVAAFNSAI